MVWPRVDRHLKGLVGLLVAVVGIGVLGPSQASAQSAPGAFSGGSGVHTSGTQTATGAQVSVGSQQTVIPTTGRNAHRGRGASSITCTFRTIDVANPLGGAGPDAGNPNALPAGTQTWRTCYDTATGARVDGPSLYTSTGPGNGGAAPDVTAQLVEQALANIDIDLPVPSFSPPNQTFPNFDTWFWTDELATQSASA